MRRARFRLATLFDQLGWGINRALGMMWRRFGLTAVLAMILVVLIAVAAFGERWQVNRMDVLQQRIAELERSDVRDAGQRVSARTNLEASSGRNLLRAFESHLLPHDDIPVLLQDLLRIADEEGVTLNRGEYRVEPDTVGDFLRYRMELPMQGPAPTVYRFIARALSEKSSLALSSVHFRRARIDVGLIEARAQWVVLANMPGKGTQPTRQSSGFEE